MKLLTPEDIKKNKDAQIIRDISRTNEVRDALLESEKELNLAQAKFEAQLASQRVIWAKEEEESTKKIGVLKDEIRTLEIRRTELLSPMDELKKKTDDMYTYAEAILKDAQLTKHQADETLKKSEVMADVLQRKLDDLSERETDLEKREQEVQIKEEASRAERASIIQLSKELSIKLQQL